MSKQQKSEPVREIHACCWNSWFPGTWTIAKYGPVRTNIIFCKDHHNKGAQKISWISHVTLHEMSFSQRSWNIFSAFLPLAHVLVQFKFCNQMLQTSSQRMSECVEPSSVADFEKQGFYNYPCAFLLAKTRMQIWLVRPYMANWIWKYL